jgi:hypothetical protein
MIEGCSVRFQLQLELKALAHRDVNQLSFRLTAGGVIIVHGGDRPAQHDSTRLSLVELSWLCVTGIMELYTHIVRYLSSTDLL